jgi:hypothetical protein
MAHRPFWFHPELNEDGKVANLVPLIMRGKAPLALTSTLIEQVSSLIAQTASLAEAAARSSAPAAERARR